MYTRVYSFQVVVNHLTVHFSASNIFLYLNQKMACISPYSAAIALGSEISGGIQEVRAEDITAVHSESGVRIMTARGRGGFVKDIYVKRMTL